MKQYLLSPFKHKISKISETLYYLIILFLPTQLGKHFWPDFSYIMGIRVDYLSPTLYLTDLLIILLMISWLITSRFSRPRLLIFSALFLFLGFGVFFSKNPLAGIYSLAKLLEFVFVGFYTARFIKNKKQLAIVISLFSAGLLFESLLAIFQYLKQTSLGGPMYLFGERMFNSQTPGIANASLNGELVLRPYGTFPHPNVLAGYLLFGMTFIILNFKFLIFNQFPNFKKNLLNITMVLGTIALFLTMSRIAILIWLIILSFYLFRFFKKNLNLKIFFIFYFLIFILFILSPFQYRFTQFDFKDESFVRRQELVSSSLEMAKQNIFLGVGINNFLTALPRVQKEKREILFIQPVHNIYLLILSQTGIPGFGFFVWFIVKTYKRIINPFRPKNIIYNSKFIILSCVLLLGFFDHYFLTLQQGQLLFSFVIGLCWSKTKIF